MVAALPTTATVALLPAMTSYGNSPVAERAPKYTEAGTTR